MQNDLEQIYESMLTPSILGVIRQALPLSPVKAITSTREEEEDMEEDEEEESDCEDEEDVAESHVEVAREILSVVT